MKVTHTHTHTHTQKNEIIRTKFAALRKPVIAAVLDAESKAKLGRQEERVYVWAVWGCVMCDVCV